jgi:hypothetical protein
MVAGIIAPWRPPRTRRRAAAVSCAVVAMAMLAAMGSSASAATGATRVTLANRGPIDVGGTRRLVFRVVGKSAAPGPVTVQVSMVEMAMDVPPVAATALGGGLYAARVPLAMAGGWQATVTVGRPGHRTTATIPFTVAAATLVPGRPPGRVTLASGEPIVAGGTRRLVFRIRGAAAGIVTVRVGMPAMPMHVPAARATALGGGLYAVRVPLTMAGAWQATVALDIAGHRSTSTIPFNVLSATSTAARLAGGVIGVLLILGGLLLYRLRRSRLPFLEAAVSHSSKPRARRP